MNNRGEIAGGISALLAISIVTIMIISYIQIQYSLQTTGRVAMKKVEREIKGSQELLNGNATFSYATRYVAITIENVGQIDIKILAVLVHCTASSAVNTFGMNVSDSLKPNGLKRYYIYIPENNVPFEISILTARGNIFHPSIIIKS